MEFRKQGYRASVLPRRSEENAPSIMQSLDSISLIEPSRQLEERQWETYKDLPPDVTITNSFTDLNLRDKDDASSRSFLLFNGEEHLQV